MMPDLVRGELMLARSYTDDWLFVVLWDGR